MKHSIDIIFENDNLVVVNKPPLVLTIPDRYSPNKFNLLHFLRERYEDIFVVHRLDKETSGILVFAKNEVAHKALNTQFESRQVSKEYLVLTEGRFYEKEGLIDKPIAKHFSKPRMVISSKGKPSQTSYKVLEEWGNFSLVAAQIHTGRTHQIRVHFEALGYPLLVDSIYGRRTSFYLSEVKRKRYNLGKEQAERPLISRTSLHAHELSFLEPTTQEKLTFVAPLPKDMNAVVKQLRKLKM